MEPIGGLVLTAILAFLYFIPLMVACGRNHHQAMAIGLVNVLFGWTLLGWCVALCMACTAVRPTHTPTP
jgi:Superinfection immunity protein